MTEAERDTKIREIMNHQPSYPDAVERINKVHKDYADELAALKVAGADRVGSPSPGKSPIKQPGSDPVVNRR